MNYLRPTQIIDEFRAGALKKSQRKLPSTLIQSFFGGAFISLGFLFAIVVSGGFFGFSENNPGLTKILLGSFFPIGLVMVILTSAELFTSSCAIVTTGYLKKVVSLKDLTRIWTLSYIGNFIGAIAIAYLFTYYTGVLKAPFYGEMLENIALAKTSNSFNVTLVKGIGANWLVCLAVWQAYAAKDVIGKVVGIWLPVMAFVAIGFEHSIANMFVIPTAIFYGTEISWTEFITNNLIPATIGNIIGGAIFVGSAYTFIFSKK